MVSSSSSVRKIHWNFMFTKIGKSFKGIFQISNVFLHFCRLLTFCWAFFHEQQKVSRANNWQGKTIQICARFKHFLIYRHQLCRAKVWKICWWMELFKNIFYHAQKRWVFLPTGKTFIVEYKFIYGMECPPHWKHLEM